MDNPMDKHRGNMESRRAARAAILAPVRVGVAPKMKGQVALVQERLQGTLIDIGTLGVGMNVPAFLPKGVRVHAKFPKAAVTEPQAKGEIAFVAVVKNCRMAIGASGYRAGLEFARIAKRHVKLIDAYVKKHPA